VSNLIDYELEVLASSPTEINQIEQRMKQPSTKLLSEPQFLFNELAESYPAFRNEPAGTELDQRGTQVPEAGKSNARFRAARFRCHEVGRLMSALAIEARTTPTLATPACPLPASAVLPACIGQVGSSTAPSIASTSLPQPTWSGMSKCKIQDWVIV